MTPPRPRPVSFAQQVTGYAILAGLALILFGVLWQQSRFNPAVIALHHPDGGGNAAPGPSSPGAAASPFPQVPGFTPQGPVQRFGPENLSDKINGKAELYLAAGFQSLTVQSFSLADPPQAYLEVFLYDMGTPANAYAVFSSQRRPGAAPLALRPHAYATANALYFTSGRYYVEMILDRGVDDVAAVLTGLLSPLLAALPTEAAADSLAAAFPSAGLRSDSVQLLAADAFGLAGFNQVYTAEYSLPGGPATAFLAAAADAAAAAAAARRYREFLQANGFQVVAEPGLPPDITVLSLEDFGAAVLVVDRCVAGVHEAPSWQAALELAQQLQKALQRTGGGRE